METQPCPSCNGDGTLLGALGNLLHFRCRSCGLDFNAPAEDFERCSCGSYDCDFGCLPGEAT